MGNRQDELGHREEALASKTRQVAIWRKLAEGEAALTSVAEAVAIQRKLAQPRPGAFLLLERAAIFLASPMASFHVNSSLPDNPRLTRDWH